MEAVHPSTQCKHWDAVWNKTLQQKAADLNLLVPNLKMKRHCSSASRSELFWASTKKPRSLLQDAHTTVAETFCKRKESTPRLRNQLFRLLVLRDGWKLLSGNSVQGTESPRTWGRLAGALWPTGGGTGATLCLLPTLRLLCFAPSLSRHVGCRENVEKTAITTAKSNWQTLTDCLLTSKSILRLKEAKFPTESCVSGLYINSQECCRPGWLSF